MYWQNFINKSTNRKIFGAALVVAAMTALVFLSRTANELIIAWKFGTGDDIEAFLIARLIPYLLVSVIGGSFNAAFIPTYIQVKQLQGTPASQKLLSGVNAWSSVLLVLATIIMLLTAPVYLRFV
ncbi:MAG: lipid II flippase MurJ, partial [Sphaerospermopsis kisseleviana]